jgi:hypothetical protein
MVKKIPEIEMFKRGIGLLQNNPDSHACLVFCRIAAWNFSFVESPAMAVAAWNMYLPSKLKVNIDAFDDKGITPEWMTKSEMEEIRKIEGVTDNPMEEGFDPFYTWKFPQPTQSEIFIKQQKDLQKARAEYLEKYTQRNKTMAPQRYWGD